MYQPAHTLQSWTNYDYIYTSLSICFALILLHTVYDNKSFPILPSAVYCIAGNIGENYIWRFGKET